MSGKRIKWMDGSFDTVTPGKLLTDNPNFFGDCILTGVTYQYKNAGPTGVGDSEKDIKEFRGRRLIDGDILCRFRKPVVEMDKGTLTVVFDFQQILSFSEVDCYMRSPLESASWEVSEDGEQFFSAFVSSFSQDTSLYRMKSSSPVTGRYLRLTLNQPDMLKVVQVWVWGDKEEIIGEQSDFKKNYFEVANSISLESLMGIPQTAFSDVQGFLWAKQMRKEYAHKVYWSEQKSYGSLASQPILPKPEQVNKTVTRRIFRNSTETVCLALTNGNTDNAVKVTVSLENDSPLQAELFAFGHIQTRWYGVVPAPLLNEEHRISRPLLYKYLKNAPVIAEFPTLNLPAGGSCLLWLKISGNQAPAGSYRMQVLADDSAITIETQVLPISLDTPNTAVLTYGYRTEMWPFEWEDRNSKEVAYRNELGANIYRGWPEPGTVNDEARRTNPTVQFMVGGLGEFHDRLFNCQVTPEELRTPEAQEKLRKSMGESIQKAEKLGLDYSQWFLELPDEPGHKNAAAVSEVVRFIKREFPEVRIYANPAFWVGFENGAVADDDALCNLLEDWYPLIDLSFPLLMLLWDRPKAYKYFSQEREFNGQYQVSAQHMRSDKEELINLPRHTVWESLARNMNSWGFFAYHEPALDSWDETKRPEVNRYGTINYQCVYAGEFGPIPTRASELLREGYQDYCIMEKLREKNPELCAEIKAKYLAGCRDYEALITEAVDGLMAP